MKAKLTQLKASENKTPIEKENPQLSTLIILEQQARKVKTKDELKFIFVNYTYRLCAFSRAIFWTVDYGNNNKTKVNIELVSSTPTVDKHTPLMQWYKRLTQDYLKSENAKNLHQIDKLQLSAEQLAFWDEQKMGYALWCPFTNKTDQVIAGMWLFKSSPWQDKEIALLEALTASYASSWQLLSLQKNKSLLTKIKHFIKPFRILIALALIGLLFIPISQTVLAPGEISSVDTLSVNSPLNAVIQTIVVKPNQSVKKNQLLFTFDSDEIKQELNLARSRLEVSEADYLRARQKSFTDNESKSQLELYRQRVNEKQLDLNYAKTRLELTNVYAQADGVAVFSDANKWQGRPVQIGEQIMRIANPNLLEMILWMPVEDALNLAIGAKVRMFLDIDPLNPVIGEIIQTSYEPQLSPNKINAFRLLAKINHANESVRIGLKGTGKVYGEKVTLGYYIFRRPIKTMRQMLGI